MIILNVEQIQLFIRLFDKYLNIPFQIIHNEHIEIVWIHLDAKCETLDRLYSSHTPVKMVHTRN